MHARTTPTPTCVSAGWGPPAGQEANGINGLCFGSGNLAVLGALRVTTALVRLTVCARTAGLPACSGDCRMALCASSCWARLPPGAPQSPAREARHRSFWLRQNEHSLMQARRPAVRAGTTVPIDLGSIRQSEPVNAIGHPAGWNVDALRPAAGQVPGATGTSVANDSQPSRAGGPALNRSA